MALCYEGINIHLHKYVYFDFLVDSRKSTTGT